jgi:hypothetical protein
MVRLLLRKKLSGKGLIISTKEVAEVIEEGKVRTYDMMKMRGKPDVINNGAASTKQMADAIIAKL